ncbi:MAG: tRNA lysidine(34) synthetase TilS [Bacteroidota bacterium]
MQSLEQTTRVFIEQETLFTPQDHLLVAISGGIDSVCLAHLLWSAGYQVALAHINHQLRGEESNGDQAFVERLAKAWKVELRLTQVQASTSFSTPPKDERQGNTPMESASPQKSSIQLTARTLRYAFFDELLAEGTYDYVLTAHHLEDNLETSLLNLLRGSGLVGLAGIPPKRGHYRRPFLSATRQQIRDYAAQHQLLWREDRTNATDAYRRNHLRHHVLPALQRNRPDWADHLRASYQNMLADRALFNATLKSYWENLLTPTGHLKRSQLPPDPIVAERLLSRMLRPYGFKGDQFRQMLQAQHGSIIRSATGPAYLVVDEEIIQLFLTGAEGKQGSFRPIKITTLPATVALGNGSELQLRVISRPKSIRPTDGNLCYLSLNAISLPLTVRSRQAGDQFQPFGMEGKRKKLKEFFIDQKLSHNEKDMSRLLCNADGQIIWVIGQRMSELARITENELRVIAARVVSPTLLQTPHP